MQWYLRGLNPGWGLSVWSLHVLPVYAWVLSRYSGVLPPLKNVHVRFIFYSKLTLGVSVSMDGGLFNLSLCGPVMDWRPCPGCTRSHPMTVTLSWIRQV